MDKAYLIFEKEMEAERQQERREQDSAEDDPVGLVPLARSLGHQDSGDEAVAERSPGSGSEESSEECQEGDWTNSLDTLAARLQPLFSDVMAENADRLGRLDGEILSGKFINKLENELSSIENAMSTFEGRLDTLRSQAQDLLLTMQKERMEASSESQASAGPGDGSEQQSG